MEKINGINSIDGLPIYTLDETVRMERKILYLIAVKNDLQNEWQNAAESKNLKNVIDFPDIFRKIKPQIVLNEQRRKPAMEITPLIGCSINCLYCPQSRLLKVYKGSKEVYLKDFKEYLLKIPAEADIVFSGFVEPFLARDSIDMMEYAAGIGRNLHLYTTLSGLTEETFERVKKINFRTVNLHLPDKNGYAKIPLNEHYYNILEAALEAKKVDGQPFIKKASSQCEPEERAFALVKNKVPVSCKMSYRAGHLKGKNLVTRAPLNKTDNFIYCSFNLDLTSNVLLPNGDVVICCMDFGLRHVLGNLKTDSYSTIINGEERENILKGMSVGDVRKTLCYRCTEAYELTKENFK